MPDSTATTRSSQLRAGALHVDPLGVRSDLFERLLELVVQDSEAASGSTDSTAAQSREAGVFIISVAARLAHMHPQTLRKYDRAEVVRPSRTGGMLRLYSEEDVARLRTVNRLIDELGLNLEGVKLALGIAGVLEDVVRVLEGHPALANEAAARLASRELRAIIRYLTPDMTPASRDDAGGLPQ